MRGGIARLSPICPSDHGTIDCVSGSSRSGTSSAIPSRIPQIAQQMRGVITICGNLPLEPVSAVAGRDRDSLTLRSLRSVGEDIGDRLQPAGIAEAGEDECNVATDVAILMTKPVGERRQHARVMFADDGLRDLDLFPKNLFVFELFDDDRVAFWLLN